MVNNQEEGNNADMNNYETDDSDNDELTGEQTEIETYVLESNSSKRKQQNDMIEADKTTSGLVAQKCKVPYNVSRNTGNSIAPKYQLSVSTTTVSTSDNTKDTESSAKSVQKGLVMFLPVIMVVTEAAIKS